jgi:exodeoxyribonuclease VII small subunit
MQDSTLRTFDEGMQALEELVRRMEDGDLPLEEAISAFERGMDLVRHLSQRLSEAEARIEILTRAQNGEPTLQPMARPEKG